MQSVSASGLALLNEERDLLPNVQSFPVINITDSFYDLLIPIWLAHRTLPPTMTELKADAQPNAPNFYDRLPPSLKSFNYHGDGAHLLASHIPLLPRGLTALTVPQIHWQSIDVSVWPPTLTELHIYSDQGFHIDCFRLLPRSLKTLRIRKSNEGESVKDVSFETLCALGRQSLIFDDRWPSLKRSLLARDKSSAPYHLSLEEAQLDDYIESLESGRLFGLPLTLSALMPFKLPPTAGLKLLLPASPHLA